MFKEILERMLSFPQRGQVKMDFDVTKKNFHLSAPIFSSKKELPKSVKTYVESRKNSTFKPHTTYFQIEGTKVLLNQEFPFDLSFQATLRTRVDEFWQMAKKCHRMLAEIAIEDEYKNALQIDTHFD